MSDLSKRLREAAAEVENSDTWGAVDEDAVAKLLREAADATDATRTCSTCGHGTFGRDYNEPLIGNLVTGYECAKRVMVDEEGNPPEFSCSLWEPKPPES